MKLTAYEHKMEQKAWGIIRASCIPLVALKWFTMKQLGTHVLVAAIPHSTPEDQVQALMENIQKAFRKVDVERGEAHAKDDPSTRYIVIKMKKREPLTVRVEMIVEEK